MAQGLDQARRQRELTKQQLASDAARLDARIRRELDWRSRLRRDGPRIAARGAGALVLIGAIVLVRSRVRRDRKTADPGPASLDDLATELREIRDRLDRRGGDSGPVWQKALLSGVTAAGAAAGPYAAKRMMDQQTQGGKGRAEATGVS